VTTTARLRVFLLEAWYELVKVWRTPGYCVPALAFPIGFYLVFGVAMRRANGAGVAGLAAYLVATYGACGVMSAAFQSFGVNVAMERSHGWLTVKRASPMPLAAYVVAKTVVVVAFGAVIAVALSFLATAFGGVRLDVGAWLRLGLVLGIGVLPFAAIGLLIGVACGPNAVGPVSNIAFMGGAMASGLWIPMEALPGWWQRAAVALPPYHYGRLALSAIGIDSPWPAAVHVSVLAGATVLALGAAYVSFARSEERA
jgi:ABC-2 type transport system permease protein